MQPPRQLLRPVTDIKFSTQGVYSKFATPRTHLPRRAVRLFHKQFLAILHIRVKSVPHREAFIGLTKFRRRRLHSTGRGIISRPFIRPFGAFMTDPPRKSPALIANLRRHPLPSPLSFSPSLPPPDDQLPTVP